MYLKKSLFLFIIGLYLWPFGVCLGHDQNFIPSEYYQTVNPPPKGHNFRENNQNHQIIVAVVGSGIDYNHPHLRKNMHYKLDNQGRPIGLGWDFNAKDPWPAPYLASTNAHNPQAPKGFVDDAESVKTRLEYIVRMYPELIEKVHPHRAIEVETELGVNHETGVASLITQGDSKIGIVPYKCLLTHDFKEERLLDVIESYIKYTSLCNSAIEKAAADGAHIVNVSLGFYSLINFPETMQVAENLNKVFKKFPSTLFVVAAGNDGFVFAQEAHWQTSCSSELPNVLCVGGLDNQKKLAKFSVAFPHLENFVLAPSTGLTMLNPENYCYNHEPLSLRFINWENTTKRNKLIHSISSQCAGRDTRTVSFGTSFAAPLVSRYAAYQALQSGNIGNGSKVAAIVLSSSKRKLFKIPEKNLSKSIVHPGTASATMRYLDLPKPNPSIFAPKRNHKNLVLKNVSKKICSVAAPSTPETPSYYTVEQKQVQGVVESKDKFFAVRPTHSGARNALILLNADDSRCSNFDEKVFFKCASFNFCVGFEEDLSKELLRIESTPAQKTPDSSF